MKSPFRRGEAVISAKKGGGGIFTNAQDFGMVSLRTGKGVIVRCPQMVVQNISRAIILSFATIFFVVMYVIL